MRQEALPAPRTHPAQAAEMLGGPLMLGQPKLCSARSNPAPEGQSSGLG